MMIRIIILQCIFIASIVSAHAQDWSREDSIWVLNILEGKEVKINEDTKKAIEEGRLMAPSWMKNANNELLQIEIIKDVGAVDSLRIQSIDPYTMPPAVFALYVLYMDKVDSVEESRSLVLTKAERESLEAALPPGAAGGFYVNESIGGFGGLGFNHILSMVFSPSYRQKAHNGKHAVNHKYYYDEGAIRAIGFTERDRRRLRQEINILKQTSVKISGSKINGIDD